MAQPRAPVQLAHLELHAAEPAASSGAREMYNIVCIYIYIYIFVCIYLYIEREIER